jgi:hypothetical protein
VLWRNDNGLVISWLASGGGQFAGNNNLLTQVPTDWHIVGTGDFNGDGRDDILWRNNSGLVTDWLGQTNGAFIGNTGKFLSQIDNGWHVVATGDFNGDGRYDILWRHDNGLVTDWLGLSDGSFTGNTDHFLNQLGTSWQVAQTGDFNADARDDILWRSSDGSMTSWFGQTDASFASNTGFQTQMATNWHVQPTELFL